MAIFKSIELGFRKTLLRILRIAGRRGKPVRRTDFDRCKFLFIRQDRIGDVLVSTPLLAALKRRYPHAVIDVLLSSNNYFVLDHAPEVRKRWMYNKKPGDSLKILRGIRAEQYDFVVDLMDNPSATSTVILLLAGGRCNVGLEKDNRYAYDVVVPMLSRKDTHIVDRLARLLDVFGVESQSEELRIHYETAPESDKAIRTFFTDSGLAQKKVLGINISAGSDARFWGVSHYREFLASVAGQFPDLGMVLLCKDSDRDRAAQIANGHSGVVLAPRMTFDEFAAMIKHLSILLTPDTSAVHLAAAFNVPSVILYVQANPDLRIWEPYKTRSEAVVTEGETLSSLDVGVVLEAFNKIFPLAEKRPIPAKRPTA